MVEEQGFANAVMAITQEYKEEEIKKAFRKILKRLKKNGLKKEEFASLFTMDWDEQPPPFGKKNLAQSELYKSWMF